MSDEKFYGKYRATVVNNIDPEQRGRILATVPAVSGMALSSWALPCLPMAGKQSGVFTVPMIGSSVWIEFEQGDSNKPIWVGGFWGTTAEVPTLSKMATAPIPALTIQTQLQNGLIVSDLPGPTGGIMLKSASGVSITVNDTGIYIQNGKGASIVMTGPTVTINNGALVIT